MSTKAVRHSPMHWVPTLTTYEGMKIRGEPHLLLIGDPGTGKSQFLRYAAKLASRRCACAELLPVPHPGHPALTSVACAVC